MKETCSFLIIFLLPVIYAEAQIHSESSAITPAGYQAQVISEIWWWMLGISSFISALVLLLLIVGLKLRREGTPRPPGGDLWFIVSLGLVLPFVILTGLLLYMLIATNKLIPPNADLTINVTGHMWWWDVEYPAEKIRSANELYIPTGKDIRVELRSRDVIHSFWVPSLSGKTDAIPGLVNTHWLRAERPGTFWGACAEYCGLQHARMMFYVVALSPENYERWVNERKRSKVPTAAQSAGLNAFMDEGCSECHAIKGTNAQGDVGPDLTHIGSRLSLGSGTAVNNYGNLAAWIANPQAIKPGNKMPRAYLPPEQLHSLTSFLMALK
ncbi:MAG: cytochrome c oxidase subunit II [Deltaproteobacteria bacterium]|nr:cytochrome c oxidase subunit II [Deltaproteobacteria bacterium]